MQNTLRLFDQLSYVITKALQNRNATEVGELFNRNRKAIYAYRDGCTFNCDYDFICGLNKLGYDLVIVRRRDKQ